MRVPFSQTLRSRAVMGCAVLSLAFQSLVGGSDADALEVGVPQVSGGGEWGGRGVLLPEDRTGLEFPAPPQPAGPPGVGTSFDGFNFDDNAVENGLYEIPPDPMGAAGTDRLVAVVNAMIEARTKAGALLWRDSLAGFFSSLAPANELFDPKIVYDHYEGRFLVVALERVEPGLANPSAGNVSRVLLAVSKTSTPASATAADWHYTSLAGKFSIGGLDYWSDYPGLEVDEEAVYITNNLFSFAPAPDTYGGVRLWIVAKGVAGGFYSGGSAGVTIHDPYVGGGGFPVSTMPCQVYGAGGVGLGIGTFLVSYEGITVGGPGGIEAAQVVRVDNPLGAVSFTQEFVGIGDLENVGGGFGFPDLPDAPQLGTGTLIEVNDRRVLDCVWRGNQIWFTTTIAPNAGPDVGQTTAHWVKLDTSAVPAPIVLFDQGNIGGEDVAAGTYTFFPALAVNASGDAMFGFSASTSTIYPGAYVTGREASDAPGTVQPSDTVKTGVDFYIRTFGSPRNRWGDYSDMSLDPTDGDVFWVFNEYAMTRGTPFAGEDGRWGTAWGSASFAGSAPTCGASPLGGCFAPTKASLQVSEKTPGKEKLKVALKNLTTATIQGDFGDPVDGATSYTVCVYDQAGVLAAQMQVDRAGDLCGTKPCWSVISTTGYKYSDKSASADGMSKITGKAGDVGKGQIQAKGQNNASKLQLSLPTGVALALAGDAAATVQILTSEAGCFGATLTDVTKADGLEFKASLP